MRYAIAAFVVIFATTAQGADNAPKASGVINGKQIKFPEKGLPNGVKVTVGLLESCHDESLYSAVEFKKAQQGDHVRLVFAKPITAQVMNEKITVTELVFRLPMNTGVFWVRTGEKWRRYAKYELKNIEAFTAWVGQARTAD